MMKILTIIKTYLNKKTPYQPRITISGAGVLSVKSSDILKTDMAKRQLLALKEMNLNANNK